MQRECQLLVENCGDASAIIAILRDPSKKEDELHIAHKFGIFGGVCIFCEPFFENNSVGSYSFKKFFDSKACTRWPLNNATW